MRRSWSFVMLSVFACRPAPGETSRPPDPAVSGPMAEESMGVDGQPEPAISDGALQQADADETSYSASVPDTYDDGAYSIAGLRRDLDAHVTRGEAGTEVLVRAYVQEIYVPPVCRPKAPCRPAKQPHVWLADESAHDGKRGAMLMVNYRFAIPQWEAERWRGVPEVELDTGERYTFKGKLVRFSDTGFAHDQGLLEFRAYRPHDEQTGEEDQWVAPPGAHWHPIVIELEDEMNRRLMEKARREEQRRSKK